jgi:hypothetical protein
MSSITFAQAPDTFDPWTTPDYFLPKKGEIAPRDFSPDHPRRLRMAGNQIFQPVCDRARDHRHVLEWAALLCSVASRRLRTALGDARVPSAANKLDNLGSMDGIQNRRTKVAPTSNAACADAIFWRQIFWQQRGRLSAQ